MKKDLKGRGWIEKELLRHAFKQGFFFKKIDMSLKEFSKVFRNEIVPELSENEVTSIVEEAVKDCGNYYSKDKFKVFDSNLPIEHNFNHFGASLLEGLYDNLNPKTEIEKSFILNKLCFLIEDLSTETTKEELDKYQVLN